MITIEPMSKFPCERDLIVDRSRMFESLKQVKAWIELDGTHELGPGPRESQESQEERYPLSRCMTCGCCLEACPQYSDASPFIGPAALNQVRLFNLHPSGKMHAAATTNPIVAPNAPDIPRFTYTYPMPTMNAVRSVANVTSSAACRVNFARPFKNPMSGA